MKGKVMSTNTEVETDYETVVEGGELQSKSSYHDQRCKCDCDFDTEYGHYRNVEILYNDMNYHFYHKTPVVIELPHCTYRLSSGGWKTDSTKQRINRHLPSGYKLIQRSGDWYIRYGDQKMKFRNGMTISTA